jgi:hypothetical protein
MFGAVNALFTGLAFATLIYTAWMQRQELELQRAELAATRREVQGQKEQLEQQTRTFELQRFEDSFFSLVRVHTDIVIDPALKCWTQAAYRTGACWK